MENSSNIFIIKNILICENTYNALSMSDKLKIDDLIIKVEALSKKFSVLDFELKLNEYEHLFFIDFLREKVNKMFIVENLNTELIYENFDIKSYFSKNKGKICPGNLFKLLGTFFDVELDVLLNLVIDELDFINIKSKIISKGQ